MRLNTESRREMPFSGERMRKVRKLRRISQREVAEKVNITQKMVSQYERSVFQPNASTLDAIANALGCSLDYLFERSERVERVELSDEDLAFLNVVRRIGGKAALDNFMDSYMSKGGSGD